MEQPIRVLHIIPGSYICGGIENFIMNYYRHIDRSRVQFDFLVHYTQKGYFDQEIKQLGGKIYYFSFREDKDIFRYIYQLHMFFKKHKEYKIIHGHMPSLGFIYHTIARMHGVKIRIAHSHVTSTERTPKGNLVACLTKLVKHCANTYFACSQEAGRYMFGKRPFQVIHNAIDTQKFAFNLEMRSHIRNELDLQNRFVIGHVGRFAKQKNHGFLVDVFKEVYLQEPNSVLLLIGTGELEEAIRQKVKRLGLSEHVIFGGLRDNVQEFYQAMDVFVLPSLFEGLCIVGIEAQASGLPCLFSDTISNEVKMTEQSTLLPLGNPADWSKRIMQYRHFSRKDQSGAIVHSNYEIHTEAQKLWRFYLEKYALRCKKEYNK